MGECSKLSRHFWLTQGMARALGVDLNGALRAGKLERAEYAEAIAACCGCDHYQECLAWLAVNGASAQKKPGFCALGPFLDRAK